MDKIYIVAESGYEHTSCIRAFGDKARALAALEEIRSHMQAKPQLIDDGEREWTPEREAAFDAWDAAYKAWRESGPAPGTDCDSFDLHIIELDFIP